MRAPFTARLVGDTSTPLPYLDLWTTWGPLQCRSINSRATSLYYLEKKTIVTNQSVYKRGEI